jgi:hypothetical protein
MPIIETAPVEGINSTRIKVARGDYSFAVDGGTVSTIALMGATNIPSGAVVIGGYIDITTTLTSGGAATIAVQVEGAGDIVAATAVASWTAGLKNILPADTTASLSAATRVKTTAARDISIVIATAALTAGVFKVVLFYLDPQTP